MARLKGEGFFLKQGKIIENIMMILIVLNVPDVENLNNEQDQCSEHIFIFGHKLLCLGRMCET